MPEPTPNSEAPAPAVIRLQDVVDDLGSVAAEVIETVEVRPIEVRPRPVIRLNNELSGVGNATEKAKVFGHYADSWSRIGMVVAIAGIFIWLNTQVMAFVQDAFAADLKMLGDKTLTPGERLVTTQLIMGLIGATVVQVGVGIIAIVGYLFPKQDARED